MCPSRRRSTATLSPSVRQTSSSIVEDLGQHVVGVVSAQDQAVALAAERQPQLIWPTIQLEDGSSGIEAVKEILAVASKPVVFIAAYPDAYLSAFANRPEPAILLPEPFNLASVRAAGNQALFCLSRLCC